MLVYKRNKGGYKMRIVLAIGLFLGLCGSVMALPLGVDATYRVEVGDIAIPGSINDECNYSHELRIERPFTGIIGSISLIPFVSGEIFEENFVDGLLLTLYSVGAEAKVTDNLLIGTKRSFYEWKNADGESRNTAYLKVKF